MICIFVERGRDEVLPAYNHEEEISESTSRTGLESNVSMFDSLKSGFRRTNQQSDDILSTFQQAQDHANMLQKVGKDCRQEKGKKRQRGRASSVASFSIIALTRRAVELSCRSSRSSRPSRSCRSSSIGLCLWRVSRGSRGSGRGGSRGGSRGSGRGSSRGCSWGCGWGSCWGSSRGRSRGRSSGCRSSGGSSCCRSSVSCSFSPRTGCSSSRPSRSSSSSSCCTGGSGTGQDRTLSRAFFHVHKRGGLEGGHAGDKKHKRDLHLSLRLSLALSSFSHSPC